MQLINERSSKTLTVTVTGADGQPASPPMTYRIDDVLSGEAVRAATALNVVDGVATINLTPDDTVILDTNNAEEPRVITLRANTDTADEFNQEVEYAVTNLRFVT